MGWGYWREELQSISTGLAILGIGIGVAGTLGGAFLGYQAAGAGASSLWTLAAMGIGAGIGNYLGRAGMALVHAVGAAIENLGDAPSQPYILQPVAIPSGPSSEKSYDGGGLSQDFDAAKTMRRTGTSIGAVSTARIFKDHKMY